jgi:hypothetical protein
MLGCAPESKSLVYAMPIPVAYCPSLHWLPTASGFHNASLYEALRPSIPPLVALLRGEEEDKTRANAAGEEFIGEPVWG